MSVNLGPLGFLKPYSSGTATVPISGHVIIASNFLFGGTNLVLSPGTYVVSCRDREVGDFASCALVDVTGTAWSIEPSRQITYFSYKAMSGQVALNGSQTATTVALTVDTGAQWIAVGNTTAAAIEVSYTIIKLV